MQRVLHRPMTSHGRGESLAVTTKAAEVVTGVSLFNAVLLVRPNRDADRLEALLLRSPVKMRRGRDLIVLASLQTTVSLSMLLFCIQVFLFLIVL